MRITSKGQVTIPAHIREQAGLLPGAEIDFVLDEDGVRIVLASERKGPSRGQQAVRRLRGTATIELSTDEIMALTRDSGG